MGWDVQYAVLWTTGKGWELGAVEYTWICAACLILIIRIH